jgi:ParB family chromosome partitioning protein
MLAGITAGHAQAQTDKRLAAASLHAAEVGLIPLADVLGRVGNLDTREPTPESIDALAESLDALGLLEPLVVDKVGRLLAGKTRLIALRRLAAKNPDRWGKVPVRRMDFDAEADPARALAVEVAENEQRRDYTPAEVRALAERLADAGFKATAGRPRKGTKALLPALGAVVGKSKRTLLRWLDPDAEGETVPPVTFSQAAARLRRALGAFARDTDLAHLPPAHRRLVKDAAALDDLLAEAEEEANDNS